MNGSFALFPMVENLIDFEVLLKQARVALNEYSETTWSNTDEHDPGITLLEAICYNTSDLAYRTSLPLVDLLTPAPSRQIAGDGIFPAAFGPQQALTCGPVSEEDYRRALLDLHSTGQDGGHFYFDNVQLVREPEQDRYTYWYDHRLREYSYSKPQGDEGPAELTLLGNYFLYVQPSRQTQVNRQMALAALDAYLAEHRNLGEFVSKVIWVEPEDIIVRAVIMLEDDVDTTTSVPAILANIYCAIDNYITPLAARYSTEQLQAQEVRNEEIYQGPYLRHGWITRLPPKVDYTKSVTVNLARLINVLLSIEGVKSIQCLAADGSPTDSPWVWNSSPGYYPRLWGDRPLERLASGDVIELKAHGIEVTASASDIAKEIPSSPMLHNLPVVLPYFRWRDPSKYYPAKHLLPPCYGLLQPATSPEQVQLQQFMMPFEQLLANGCQQLELLPNLLSFDRIDDDVTWGAQWPLPPFDYGDAVFESCAGDIKEYLNSYSHDIEKELSYVDYLLGYFNGKIAQRDFMIDQARFRSTQQGYLGRISELTYNRSNIRTGKVSALQQRIAARFGIGGQELFNGKTPLDALPFYLVEHRALMPTGQDSQFDTVQSTSDRSQEVIAEVEYLTLYVPADSSTPSVGQVVDLILTVKSVPFTIRALMVARVDGGGRSFSLSVSSSAELQRNMSRIMDSSNEVRWKNCNVWLEDMYYPLVYADEQNDLPSDERRLSSSPQSPYPVMMKIGDVLVFEYSRNVYSRRAAKDAVFYLKGQVISTDTIANTFVVRQIEGDNFPEDEINRYFWYFDSATQGEKDRFSFAVSCVFDRDMLATAVTDAYSASDWVERTILEELPSNISLLIHWLPHPQYQNFAVNYANWQNQNAELGDVSYNLLRTLTLGCLPSSLTGIGSMAIATESQRILVVGDSGSEWNIEHIISDNLFYVPKSRDVESLP